MSTGGLTVEGLAADCDGHLRSVTGDVTQVNSASSIVQFRLWMAFQSVRQVLWSFYGAVWSCYQPVMVNYSQQCQQAAQTWTKEHPQMLPIQISICFGVGFSERQKTCVSSQTIYVDPNMTIDC